MMQEKQNVANLQEKFVVKVMPQVAKIVDKEQRAMLSMAYLKLFAGFSCVNWAEKKSLGQAWYTALGQCGAFVETKKKTNPAARYLRSVYAAHKKYWVRLLMTHKNRDIVASLPDESLKKMKQLGHKMIRDAVATINLVLARYNEYSEELVATQATPAGRATPAGHAMPAGRATSAGRATPAGQAMPMTQAVPVEKLQPIPQALPVKQPEQVKPMPMKQPEKVKPMPVMQPEKVLAKSAEQAKPMTQAVPATQAEKVLQSGAQAPIVPLGVQAHTPVVAGQWNMATVRLKAKMAQKIQIWQIYQSNQRAA